jgi:hypothetical protein
MAEMRRPNRGVPQRGVPSRSAPSAGRRSAPQPQRKPTPKLVWVGLVIATIVFFGLVWNLIRPAAEEQEQPKVVKVDPNARIKELEHQIPSLRTDYNAWRRLMQAEDPTAKSKLEALKTRIDKWMEEWDSFFAPLRDSNDRLPAELQGSYQSARTTVNSLRLDVAKSSGF